MKPERKTQEQRTADAKARLSEAAFELIRDNGYANFRVAAVAKVKEWWSERPDANADVRPAPLTHAALAS